MGWMLICFSPVALPEHCICLLLQQT